jgi:hypothetical protein
MTTVPVFVYRVIQTVNGPQEIGQWENFTVKTDLLELFLRREFFYSVGYR